MTDNNIDILKKIKEKEQESDERIRKANEEAKKIIEQANIKASQIITEAEESAKKMYEEYIRKEMERTEIDLVSLKNKYDDEIKKLKYEVSKDAIKEMLKTLLE